MEERWTKKLDDGRVATYTHMVLLEEWPTEFRSKRESWVHVCTETIEGDTDPIAPIKFLGPPDREIVELHFNILRKSQQESRLKEEARTLEGVKI